MRCHKCGEITSGIRDKKYRFFPYCQKCWKKIKIRRIDKKAGKYRIELSDGKTIYR